MIEVRDMRREEARTFLEVHHKSVRGLAAGDYPQSVIDDWAPLPITDRDVHAFLRNPDNEIRLVALIAGTVVGIGALVAEKSELRACYVLPGLVRKGVGAAIVREIEDIARVRGVLLLHLDASLMAETFYRALGYRVRARGTHERASGVTMDCVRMEKRLAQS